MKFGLGVVLPKQSVYTVAFMQANRPSLLHVPHVGVQSTGIVSELAHISGELLHAVDPGHV